MLARPHSPPRCHHGSLLQGPHRDRSVQPVLTILRVDLRRRPRQTRRPTAPPRWPRTEASRSRGGRWLTDRAGGRSRRPNPAFTRRTNQRSANAGRGLRSRFACARGSADLTSRCLCSIVRSSHPVVRSSHPVAALEDYRFDGTGKLAPPSERHNRPAWSRLQHVANRVSAERMGR